jgi:diguanylate cyclase (GGDEF)-like protein
MLRRAFVSVEEWVEWLQSYYRSSATCRAICQALILVLSLVGFDALSGYPTGLRMAYVLPTWLAVKRGGRQAGAALVLITAVLLAAVDAGHQRQNPSILINFVVQTTVLYGLMHIFDSVESKLRDAARDALTGLNNRLAIEEKAKRALDRAMLLGSPLSIAMIDCDRFKELNDRFGHAVGDEVLRILARTLRRSLPSDAIIGRTGGDEFVAVLPNRNRSQANSTLEAALDRFMSHTEIVGRGAGFSFGVASSGPGGIEYSQLVENADKDMYRNKAERASFTLTLAG